MHASLLFVAAASLPLTTAEPIRTAPASSTAARILPLAPVSDNGKACAPLSRHATGDRALRPRRLIDAPPADLHLAVDRRVNGCPVPALAGAPAR